jgi:formylglycine-generating enzyme
MWPEADRWRAPVNDFPPRWANAWGDDQYGLWADLTVNGMTQRMRWIEPGEFVMGSSSAERRAIAAKDIRKWSDQHESPQHMVKISDGFWLADTPCTQAFWSGVTASNPSRFKESDESKCLPVESVSWGDVMTFLTQLCSLVPEVIPMLPEEAEWEYACRAGTQTAYWWGDRPNNALANMEVAFEQTTEVKRFKPNPWGLYDVHGNVWEWCDDTKRPYSNKAEIASEEANSSDLRLLRGGSWVNSADLARSAYRFDAPRGHSWSSSGFRFALKHRSSSGAPASR